SGVADVPVLRSGRTDSDFGRTRGPIAALHRRRQPPARLPRSRSVWVRRGRARRGRSPGHHAAHRGRSAAPASRASRHARDRTAIHRRRGRGSHVVRLRSRRGVMRPVYVAGVGLHPFGRFADRGLTALGVEAVRAALRDAGVERGGFQAAFCGTVYGGVATGHKVLTALGLSGVPIVNVEAGCASGGAALSLAAAQVASGQHDTVLVLGVEKMPRGMIRSSFFEPWREEAGLAATPAYFALRAQRLMLASEVSVHDLAAVSVKNHRHGVNNPSPAPAPPARWAKIPRPGGNTPYAMSRKPFSVDEVLGSAVVGEPLRLLMLCAPNEGAAAVVVSARPHAATPVRLAAAVLRSHL